jgi:hypothetical protein
MAKQKEIKVKWGYGLGTTLFLIFMILKLTGYIAWSWWWVTAPLWIPIGTIAIILLIVFIGFLLTS